MPGITLPTIRPARGPDRWGEDGLAGICDDHQRLCFALALWNGQDPILKERLFGLTNSEGNHGEDVKEYYFYLDSTPTHSYMKYLYKYPQAAYPYLNLVETSRRRSRQDFEYELLDTGVFDQDRYFDVFVEYAKASPEDILIRITVHNRGPAWVASLGAGAAVATVRFQAPEGTTVVGLPEEECWTVPPSEEGPSVTTYYCRTPHYLHDKASHSFEVRLRIDEVVRGACTTVETLNDDPELPIRKFDPNLRNNRTEIVVNG
jgi:hypothetical protein